MIARQMYSENSKAAVCVREMSAETTCGSEAILLPPLIKDFQQLDRGWNSAREDCGGYSGTREGKLGQAITFCQLQVRYLIAFPASSSTSLEISSTESESVATFKAPGGGPILLILRPSGRRVEPRR
jgi:hypothetical protein